MTKLGNKNIRQSLLILHYVYIYIYIAINNIAPNCEPWTPYSVFYRYLNRIYL